MTPKRLRFAPLLKAILIAILINELRGLAVVAVVLAAAGIANLTTGATLLPMECIP